MKGDRTDVAIIGAGVIGCAIARELASRGVDTTVIERDSPGRHATWAAAGMLSPLGEATREGPFLEFADESLRRFGSFAHALQADSGIDVEYRTNGRLHVSLGDADQELGELADAPIAARFDVERIDGDAARSLEPALSRDVTVALRVGRDHRVNNRLLAQALVASATAAGVTFCTGNRVTDILAHRGAVAGVRLASGERIAAGHVVLAAGAWSGHVEGLPRELPVRPIRGQMFAVDTRASSGPPVEAAVQRVVFARSCYIIPRADGRLLVGATVEDVGFRRGPTPRGLAGLMAAAVRIIPLIDNLPLVETWAGFRPATPDHLPVLGADPDLRGLIYATGHFRSGILLAPITAACIADVIVGVIPPVGLDAFAVSRFPERP